MRFITGKVSFLWDKETGKFEGTLIAERETNLTLKLPDFCVNYTIHGDDVIYRRSKFGENYFDLTMKAGQRLFVKSKHLPRSHY